MFSKFEGRCTICKQKFPPGTEIDYDQRTRSASHKSCIGEQPDGTLVIGKSPEKAETPLERDLRRSIQVAQLEKKAGTNGHGKTVEPAREEVPNVLAVSDSTPLLRDVQGLLDVYEQACRYAEPMGINPLIVRAFVVTAFINRSKKGGQARG